MFCPKCQHRNPDDNRFCGHCGYDLTQPAPTIYPREGYDEGELPAVSEIENEVPHFRRDVPPLRQSEYGPPIDAPNSEMPSLHSDEASEPASRDSHEVIPMPPSESLRSYGSSSSILFNLDPRDTAKRTESSPRERIRTPEPLIEPERTQPSRRSEGIHGPSFLGLADSAEPDFLDDIDEPKSHARRNWFLLALVIVIVLAVVQWRNIRETGMTFAGSMKLNLPHKGEQAKPAETAATDHPSENGPANSGKPEIVVNPENKSATDQQAAQNSTQPANENAANANTANASAQPSGDTSQPASSNAAQQQGAAGSPPANQQGTAKNDNALANSSGDKQGPTQQAKNAAPAPANANTDPADDSVDSDNTDTAAKAPAKSARAARAPARPAASSAGTEELARANSAGSPETAAKWLWASTSKGNLDAPVRLADMYATGRGVSKDCEQATVLLRSSARRGNPRASARLGMYYAIGQCVPQDRTQGWHWLSLAHQRDPNSDWITQYRQRLWSEMTPDERARAGNGPSANASE